MSMLKPIPSEEPAAPDRPVLFEVEIVTFTRALADRYLTLYGYDKQRQVRPLHVEELAEEMLAGRFEPTGDVGLAHVIARIIMVNAYHTLTAICLTGIPEDLAVKHFRCADLEQVGRLYAAYDINKTRLAVDRLKALGVTEELTLTDREIGSIVSGLKLILGEFIDPMTLRSLPHGVAVARSAQLWADILREYEAELQTFLAALHEANNYRMRQKMLRGAVLAVALVTLKHQPARAIDFWAAIAKENRLERGAGEHTLARFINDSTNKREGRGVDGAAYVACAWNAFFEGRQVSLLRRIDDKKVGLTIKGTPFEARDRLAKAGRG